jgi:hypothetical protein
VHWEWPIGALCAFLLALITTPAGVSGVLFNVAAVPGGLLRFRAS